MKWQIANARIIDSVNGEQFGHIIIDGNKIESISVELDKTLHTIDVAGKTIIPGFIDIHIHGAAGYDAMDATQQALQEIARALVKEGTTSFLATTMTQSDEAISSALLAAAKYEQQQDGAELVGIHLEGPYVSKKRAGAQPLHHIVKPNIEQFERWQQLAQQKIRVATVAGEERGALELIAKHKGQVIFSLGHTDASHEQMVAAREAGAKHITHLYNQMSPFTHRDAQAIGTALVDDHFYTELIVDGIHSAQQAVQIAYRMKTADKLILITDAMRAKQMPAGEYELGGQKVFVTEHDARLEDGTLAGSILKMDDAVKNMRRFTKCNDIELVKMSSYNAAKQLGLNKGRVAAGFDADLLIVTNEWELEKTIRGGIEVFSK